MPTTMSPMGFAVRAAFHSHCAAATTLVATALATLAAVFAMVAAVSLTTPAAEAATLVTVLIASFTPLAAFCAPAWMSFFSLPFEALKPAAMLSAMAEPVFLKEATSPFEAPPLLSELSAFLSLPPSVPMRPVKADSAALLLRKPAARFLMPVRAPLVPLAMPRAHFGAAAAPLPKASESLPIPPTTWPVADMSLPTMTSRGPTVAATRARLTTHLRVPGLSLLSQAATEPSPSARLIA